jgi:lipoprotein-releasing system ATP-binding protein
VLVVSGLKKSFRKPSGETLEVLRDVSFAINAGEMVAITGPSGAGKSTLLHLLGGLERADAGEINLDQFDIMKASANRLATYRQRDAGFVFQFHNLLPDLSALENVAMPLLIARISKSEAMRRAALMLEKINLGERAAHSLGQLSGGEQQRIAVARALVTEPRIVLADEPTGNLDAQTGADLSALLKAYSLVNETTVIVATHNEHLAETCNRVLALRDGKIEDIQKKETKD